RSPTSTLFPYTTLFRSRTVLAASLVLLALVGGIIGTTWGMLRATEAEADTRAESVEKDKARVRAEKAEQAERASKLEAMDKLCGDRKSTRLNSSHVKIS